MRVEDLDAVMAIEESSFASPWRREHFLAEIERSEHSRPVVALVEGLLVAYAIVWSIEDEFRINNFAVAGPLRGRGFGGWLLGRVLELARADGCREAYLDVREGNQAAIALYSGFGFEVIGRRKGYYAREGEDALVMRAALEPASD